MSNQSYILVGKPHRKRYWSRKPLSQHEKVIKHLEEHISKMNDMYLKTSDKYYLEAYEYSLLQLELAKSGSEEVLNRFNFGK